MFGGLGGFEIIVILFIILLLFGAKKLPELAKGLGKGINEFKKASNEIKEEVEKAVSEDKKNK
jgi:sec-independent protein translocase protein TatA|tara:strand:+ start:381 stop:569 length:189 start_codon:yes stop_codon:yes gene_type:complete